MLKISKTQLAANLDYAIGANVGLNGLKTLIYGWLHFRKYGQKYREVIWHRKWLYSSEVRDLSEYAQCDLTKNEC